MNIALQLPDLQKQEEWVNRPTVSGCPICDSNSMKYLFRAQGTPIVQCDACQFVFRNPQPSNAELEEFRTDKESRPDSPSYLKRASSLHKATNNLLLDQLDEYLVTQSYASRRPYLLLQIGCGQGDLLVEAHARGYKVAGIELSHNATETANTRLGEKLVICSDIENAALQEESFDICVIANLLEEVRNPTAFIQAARRLIKPGGLLLLTMPSLDSLPARLLKERWPEFRTDHLLYFNSETIGTLLFREGFEAVNISSGRRMLSLEHVASHLHKNRYGVLSSLIKKCIKLLPSNLQQRHFPGSTGEINVMCRKTIDVPPASRDHRLSVIVPVYNEKTTFTQMMEQLLAKEIPNLSIDIIIVESKSSDGTRELVTNYEKNPKVTVIYQAEAKGKGNAVRAGLAIAKGDYIIIQDADLEYDLDDYDLLLEPLKRYRRAFVLGSRHTSRGAWKIRQFSKSRYLGVTMNVAHLVLAGIFNCLFFQSIKDPFTMFKVFRRDCLHDMNLTCNGFDFDCELIARLVQAGYRPLEIPINYSSRSFAEGKKISFFGDPPTYIAAFLKCRFSKARG